MLKEDIKYFEKPEFEIAMGEHSDKPLRLSAEKTFGIPYRILAEQIECRKKAGKKFPFLKDLFRYYDKIALEQSSGEIAAKHKASLFSGSKFIDITGGFGIDFFCISRNYNENIYCETNENLFALIEFNRNYFVSHSDNRQQFFNEDGIEILKQFPDKYFDLIFADPARREGGKRSVDIKFCRPDVIKEYSLLRSKAAKLCFKLAPAFDLTEAFRLFPDITECRVVSAEGECKEVLVIIDPADTGKKTLTAAVLGRTDERSIVISSGYYESRTEIRKDFCAVLKGGMYFCEPDPAIIKSGLTADLAANSGLKFIGKSSVYLASETIPENFPGRVFRLEEIIPYKKKLIKEYFSATGITSANVARRDFPLSPEEIKKQFGLKDGGDIYLFLFTGLNGELFMAVCRKAC